MWLSAVLLTDVPWNAKEIEKLGCGKIITEDPVNIAENALMFMSRDMNQKFRDNSIEYSKNFDYNTILSRYYEENKKCFKRYISKYFSFIDNSYKEMLGL